MSTPSSTDLAAHQPQAFGQQNVSEHQAQLSSSHSPQSLANQLGLQQEKRAHSQQQQQQQQQQETTEPDAKSQNRSSGGSMSAEHASIMMVVDEVTKDQLHYAQLGLVDWQLFNEDGQMKLYSRELVVDGLVCDPLKAVRVVRGVTAHEVCHRFFSPAFRFEWEETLESMKVIDIIDENTLIFHQIHKRIWPAAQRDAVFWSHIRQVEEPKSSCLSADDINPQNRLDLKLLDVWMVCNNSIEKPEVAEGSCVRVKLTVSLVCETYIPVSSSPNSVKRDELICKIIYSSTINPGGWAPATILRTVYRREYPRFLENFSNYVIEANRTKAIAFK